MSTQAVQDFLEQGQRSGLFSEAQTKDIVAQLTAQRTPTAEELAARLVEEKLLTPYQAERLLAGRGEECLVASRYRILEKLGEGGMGAVYKARDTTLDRLVALKVLPAGGLHDQDAVTRFQREARALARLSHPNIIQAYDSGEERGRHFLVMEYVDGITLDRVLRQHGALPPTVAADFVYQAALGLHHAHERGLIHRDIKPGNLLVAGDFPRRNTESHASVTLVYRDTPSPRRGRPGTASVKILDLGLARFLQDQIGDLRLTGEGMGVGTPDYMAPEQFRNALNADVRTDIYGLGCTLYHLIAGQVPYPGSSFSQKAEAHARKEPIPLEERCPDMPGGLALVVAMMMAKHPGERFQSAGEVADALVPYVAGGSHSMVRLRQTGRWHGTPTVVHAPPFWRVWPWAAALAVTALVLLGVLAFGWPGFLRPDRDTSPDENPSVAPQVVTIENGLTVSQDGRGQFSTIGAALAKVKPGQTIRVLDAGIYRENLSIGSRSHRGITLEGSAHPTIEASSPVSGLLIGAVGQVTIRGFRFRPGARRVTLIRARGACPGLRLEDLDMDQNAGNDYLGVVLNHVEHAPTDPPIVIRGCVFHRPIFGVQIEGIEADQATGALCNRVIVRDNEVVDPSGFGILVRGLVKQVHVVGNRIRGITHIGALQLDTVREGSGPVLFANNTIFECTPSFRLWDDAVRGNGIEFRNNLILGAGAADMLFLERRDKNLTHIGAGDVTSLLKKWRFGHNWREVRKPTGESVQAKAWIPPPETDVVKEQIDVLSRDPESADFLRPAAESPLSSAGVGGDLPSYVGAVPPPGRDPWDWDRTWKAREGKSE